MPENEEAFMVKFTPGRVGRLKADILWAGEHVARCPFEVDVCDASKCSAFGPGLTNDGRVSEPVNFTVLTKDAGEGQLEIRPRGPNATYPTTVKDNGDNTYNVTFTPWEKGPHMIDIDWSGAPIPKSPYPLTVLPKVTASQITAAGEGLRTALSLTPAHFVVTTPEAALLGDGKLTITVASADEQAMVETKDAGDGTYPVQYVAPTSGAYTITIKFADENIPNSPYSVNVLPRPEAEKCVASGKCLNPDARLLAGDPMDIAVSTKEAGQGALRVVAQKPNGTPTRAFLSADDNGEFVVRVDVPEPGRYTVHILWSEKNIPKITFLPERRSAFASS